MKFTKDNLPLAFFGYELVHETSMSAITSFPNPDLVDLLRQINGLVPYHIGLSSEKIIDDLVIDEWVKKVNFIDIRLIHYEIYYILANAKRIQTVKLFDKNYYMIG